jgi:hypothetical protein
MVVFNGNWQLASGHRQQAIIYCSNATVRNKFASLVDWFLEFASSYLIG